MLGRYCTSSVALLLTPSSSAGLVNLSRDSVLLIHSAEELSKKELFGLKQVVSRGVMCKYPN